MGTEQAGAVGAVETLEQRRQRFTKWMWAAVDALREDPGVSDTQFAVGKATLAEMLELATGALEAPPTSADARKDGAGDEN